MRRCLFSAILLFISTFSFSQNSIVLSGRVLNKDNEPVANATVQVKGVTNPVRVDVEGRFTLSLAPNKKYEITVSCSGYQTKELDDVLAVPGADNTITVVLDIKKQTGEAAVIRTSVRRESTSALLNFQKNNTALSSGVSADFIRRTPDKNTGEVLKRVSGASIQDNKFVIVRGLSDRYNSAVINNAQMPSSEPDKKAFSFDVIPAALIDNIVINKTATPELPGEFAGGLVQINTKDVPSRDILSVGISIGFNTRSVFRDFTSNTRNATDWLGYDNGTRSLPDGFPATAQAYRALSGSATGVAQQIALSKLFNNDVFAETNSTALPTQTYSLTWGNSHRFKKGGVLGTILALQYRNSMLMYDVERELHENDGDVLVRLNDRQNRYSINTGAIANITYVQGRHKISFKNLFNQLFEDNYYTRTGVSNDRLQDISFRSSVLNQRSLYSAQLEGSHQITKSGVKLIWNGNFSYNWKAQPDLRTSAYFRTKGTSDPFEFNDDDTRRFFSSLKDYSYGANGNITIPYTLGKNKQTLKLGGSTLIRIRDFKSRIFRYEPANILFFDATKNELSFDKIFAPGNMANDGFKILDFTNNQDKYFGVSVLNGMFGQFDNKFGEQIRLVWGVRAENFQQFLTTRDVTAKRVNVLTEKWDILPSFNLTWSPVNQHSIRVSGSRTVARPEFREIAPFAFFDYEVNYAVNGNPNLKRSDIINGDIRYEFYPKAGEAITAGVFYKSFNDPIELRLNPSSVLDRRNYEFTNADKAYTIGAEVEVRKSLSFLNKKLENFSVFTNITYIQSKVTLASTSGSGTATTANRPLQGQSPYLVNFGLQYDNKNKGLSGSVLYNRIGQRLALVGINDLGFPDVYERPRNQVDIQLAKKIIKNRGELKLTWADALNPAYYFYENVDAKKAFKSGTDRLFNAWKPGSTITLGFTYDFNLGKK
jgi:TonB dependent receptor/Carboxypeptidase regulatory-like domain/TonB-dependent Receptor Plug Domain